MQDQEKVFATGFYFKRRENAPSFVIGQESIKVAEAVEFLLANENEKGYVNLDIKQGRNGNYYLELNTYNSTSNSGQSQPQTAQQPAPSQATSQDFKFPPMDAADDDLPF